MNVLHATGLAGAPDILMIQNWLTQLRPSMWKPSLRAARVLLFDYGHLKSVAMRRAVDAGGHPTPWYTYPAIEYLKGLDFSGCSVFEYGSGHSTLFWSAHAKDVVSVEEDESWYRFMAPRVPTNCRLLLETDLAAYVEAIRPYPGGFDVIVVDGAARGLTRLKCATIALEHLKPGGMIVLDNSDWLPESARVLREADLIQVDMTGFTAITGYTQTTSFFLHRAFSRPPRADRQPMPGPGAAGHVWEFAPPTEAPVVAFGGEAFGAVRRDEPFTLHTPRGARPFRLLVAGRSQYGRETAAILDVQGGRVLLAITEPTVAGGSSVEDEMAAAVRLAWPDFVRFVNAHDKRRYPLEP